MTPETAVDLVRATLTLILTLCGPLLLVSLIVGLVVSLVQALTQVQEQTLTFVPKLAAMGLTLLMTLPMMGHAMADFTAALAGHIVRG